MVRVLGSDHPDTLGSRNNLAYAYRSAGRLGEAIPLFERTLADLERVLSPDHPNTLTTRHNLDDAYGAAGRVSDANSLQRPWPAPSTGRIEPRVNPGLLTC